MNANPTMKPVPVAEGEVPGAETIPLGARLGRVVAVDDEAVPLVDFAGNPHAPLRARLALPPGEARRLSAAWREAAVLLLFVGQDLRQPVIVGLVAQAFPDACWPEGVVPERLDLEASEEVVLRCGEAKITLRQDGKVVVGGREIESRAQQKHRIRGGTVTIN